MSTNLRILLQPQPVVETISPRLTVGGATYTMKQLEPGNTITITVLANGLLMNDRAYTDIEARDRLKKMFSSLTEMLADLVLTEIKFRGKEY